MAKKTHHPLTLVGTGETSLDGQTISYTIKRSARAKHLRLEVRFETGLTVVIPKSFRTLEQLPGLLERQKRWILGKLARRRQEPLFPAARGLKSGDTIPYLGRELEVVEQQSHGNTDSVTLKPNRLIVSLRPSANGRLGLVVEQWYRMQAAQLIKERADHLSARWGLSYSRLIIRGQRTRWGSCSHRGNLSFNWKLLMAPLPVIDYVIVHELAHLKEMNHTKRFWALMSEYCPRWREHKKWLKGHEAELAARLSP